jgi:CRP-like cAMP-binding protein
LSGVVRCTDGEGRSVIAGHDYLLGTISASAQRPHGYDAVAESDVRAYLIRFEDWLIVLEAHPDLAIRLLAQLASMLSATLDLGASPAAQE